MASVDPNTKTTYATTDWSHYSKGRPSYPPSLTSIIYDYRRRQPKTGWQRLVDIGAGSGIASTNFMPDFEIIHNSDPSPWNEEQARQFLPDWAKRHGLNPEFEYSQSTGEEAFKIIGENSADMVICATAAHFMDSDALMSSIAKILRPEGTVAVYSYWMPHFPDQTPQFQTVFEKTFDDMVLKPLSAGDEANRARLAKVIERRMTGNGVLDSVPVPAELFQDPQRVYINPGDGKIACYDLYGKFAPQGQKLGGISRVVPGEKIVRYDSGVDSEAEGWSFNVDKEWLSNFFDTIRPPRSKLSEDDILDGEMAYAQWEEIFDEECPSGAVRSVWPAYLVIATRKGDC